MKMDRQKRNVISVWKGIYSRKKNLKDLSMKYGQSRNVQETGPQKRRLKTKPLLVLIGILFACNVLWFIGWLIPDKSKQPDEEVASVAGEPITREQWMTAMEKEVGREVLLDLVN